ncbi:hypothetical protein [Anaerotruncus colihominis]|uniref:hypothetical protein n=1 Tax=Anaerotruncus colihominis TaxID=169435 RepID=UPI0018975D47|nr:hypothetical protein [Anaerotruncus colihominis]
MKQNQIRNIRVHMIPPPDERSAADFLNQLHIKIIERQLEASRLSPQKQCEVVSLIRQKLSTDH